MPSLRQYKPDSEKSGHYILANVGGSHPITIQVTDLGGQILQKAGYAHGDNVPTKVVWAMFDIGILYTSNTTNEPPETVDNPDQTFQQLGVANNLTAQEKDQLLNYLNEYTGPNQSEVRDLREELEQSAPAVDNETDIPREVQDNLDRLSRLYNKNELTKAEYNLLKSRLLDDEEILASLKKSDREFRATESEGKSGTTDFLTEHQLKDLVRKYRGLIPEAELGAYDSDTSKEILNFNITALPDGAEVQADFFCAPLSHTFQLSAPDQESRLRKLIDDSSYQLKDDEFDRVIVVVFGFAQGETSDEITDEEIRKEINHFFRTIITVYKISTSELSSAKITWDHYD